MKGRFDLGIFTYVTFLTSCGFVCLKTPHFLCSPKNVNVRVQFASHVPLLDMVMLFRTRSLLGPVHNCQHGEVVGLAILISAKTGTLFQNRL